MENSEPQLDQATVRRDCILELAQLRITLQETQETVEYAALRKSYKYFAEMRAKRDVLERKQNDLLANLSDYPRSIRAFNLWLANEVAIYEAACERDFN
jgi:hypothetical protein